jgi:hypothetical protein
MVKTETIVAVAIVGGIAVVAFLFLGGGGLNFGGPTSNAPSLGSGSTVSPSFSGSSSAGGAGSYSAYEAINYSPSYDYRYQYSPQTTITNQTQTSIGLFNFRTGAPQTK